VLDAPRKIGAIHAEREQMRAGLRLGFGLVAAALAFAPLSALAQDAGQATTNTPATDSIGPRELQNFSIEGTVTRQAEPQSAARPPARPATPTPASRPAAAPARRAVQTEAAPTAQPEPREAARQASETPRATNPASSVTVALPKLQDDLPRGGNAAAVPATSLGFAEPEAGGTLAPERKISFLPWLLAAVALGAGGAFLFYRRRHGREALAGGPQIDAFVAPESVAPAPAPKPAPKPAPAPPRRPPSSIPGLVSTRLRPWIDFGFEPLRCIVEDKQITVEFELELLNSGSAPARAVLVEATLFNAGPNQDAEIGAFFANPVGEGDRIAMIQPLKRTVLRPRVTIPREQVQVYEVGGRKVFVPLIAFNALYRWSGGEGQSSISYLIGRDTNGEKMAPIRLDLGPRVFRGLGSRPLPTGVRK
jgi:hypothetical protein